MKITVYELIFERCILEAAKALSDKIDDEIIQEVMSEQSNEFITKNSLYH